MSTWFLLHHLGTRKLANSFTVIKEYWRAITLCPQCIILLHVWGNDTHAGHTYTDTESAVNTILEFQYRGSTFTDCIPKWWNAHICFSVFLSIQIIRSKKFITYVCARHYYRQLVLQEQTKQTFLLSWSFNYCRKKYSINKISKCVLCYIYFLKSCNRTSGGRLG